MCHVFFIITRLTIQMKRTRRPYINAGPVPPLPQHFYHATQHNVGDWPSVPAVHLNQEKPMPQSHITECGPQNCTMKYTRQ